MPMPSESPDRTAREAPRAALGLAAAAALFAGGCRLYRADGRSRILAAAAWAAAGALAWGAVGRRVRGMPALIHRPPVTQAVGPDTPAARDLGEPGRNTERRLDEAVEETFPASDPIAVHIE